MQKMMCYVLNMTIVCFCRAQANTCSKTFLNQGAEIIIILLTVHNGEMVHKCSLTEL